MWSLLLFKIVFVLHFRGLCSCVKLFPQFSVQYRFYHTRVFVRVDPFSAHHTVTRLTCVPACRLCM